MREANTGTPAATASDMTFAPPSLRDDRTMARVRLEQAPDLRARPVAAPKVTRIEPHLGPRHRRPLGRLGGTKMHDADSRSRRQAAHRLGCAKRILDLAQMPDHRDIEASCRRADAQDAAEEPTGARREPLVEIAPALAAAQAPAARRDDRRTRANAKSAQDRDRYIRRCRCRSKRRSSGRSG